jgi:hypothetical protein
MKTNQPQQPTMPRDFTQPITARGSELSAVIAEATAQGYHGHLMKIKSKTAYQLKFFRLATAPETGKQFRESPLEVRPVQGQRNFPKNSISHQNQLFDTP